VREYALKISPYVFSRPIELCAVEWAEFDLDGCEWRIPPSRMKMGELHIVPLATQAVALLRQLHSFTASGRYLFPSLRTNDRPISENTVGAAPRRLGHSKDDMTVHGFRALASTLLNEMGFPPDVIELQLADAERNQVRAAYNRAQRLDERRRMMQSWADYLDGLRATANAEMVQMGWAYNAASFWITETRVARLGRSARSGDRLEADHHQLGCA
jgi:integrase